MKKPISNPRKRKSKLRSELKRFHRRLETKRKGKHRSGPGYKRLDEDSDAVHSVRSKRMPIEFPEKFSLIENPELTLDTFMNLDNTVKSGREKIFLKTSSIKYITIDAIMYLIILILRWKEKSYSFDIQLKPPKNLVARDLFLKSGFIEFIHGHNPSEEVYRDVFQIRSGKDRDKRTVRSAKKFASDFFGDTAGIKPILNALFNALIEVTNNSADHAYKYLTNLGQKRAKDWWIGARRVENNQGRIVQYTIIDTGDGIASTAKKLWDSIKSYSDSDIMMQALEGKLRSRTRLIWRNKGLPSILKASKEGKIQKLHILANQAFFSDSEGNCTEISNAFHGTLYYFESRRKV